MFCFIGFWDGLKVKLLRVKVIYELGIVGDEYGK